MVLGWWCLCRGSGVHKLKRAPCSPSLESGRAGNPRWRLVATISSMSPRCSSTVSQRASPASPRATQVAVPHLPVVVGGHVGVGELRPTPRTGHNDAARRHWVEVPNPRDTFGEVGVELLEESP